MILKQNINYVYSEKGFLVILQECGISSSQVIIMKALEILYSWYQIISLKVRDCFESIQEWGITLRQESIRTADKNLTDFAILSQIYWVLEKSVLISIEALICGYFEQKKLRARPPNKAATPL